MGSAPRPCAVDADRGSCLAPTLGPRCLCGEAACFVGEEESLEDLSDGLSFLVAQALGGFELEA